MCAVRAPGLARHASCFECVLRQLVANASSFAISPRLLYEQARVETDGAIDLGCAIGALGAEHAARAQELALRVKRMLRALMR